MGTKKGENRAKTMSNRGNKSNERAERNKEEIFPISDDHT